MADAHFNSMFSRNPLDIDSPRSVFPRPHKHYTSFNAGVLVPLGRPKEVLPGDTVTRRVNCAFRLSTPKFPTMDHAWVDVYSFFVPGRITQDSWKQVFGESVDPWASEDEHVLPVIKYSVNFPYPQPGSVADHMNLPLPPYMQRYANAPSGEQEDTNPSLYGVEVTANQARGYCLIWNEYFRDVNLDNAAFVPLDETDRVMTTIASEYDDPIQSAHMYGRLLPVAKAHDYFTSCLPFPQRGDDVSIFEAASAPVITKSVSHFKSNVGLKLSTNTMRNNPLGNYNISLQDLNSKTMLTGGAAYNNVEGGQKGWAQLWGKLVQDTVPTQGMEPVYPVNLYADLSSIGGATINDMRMAIATQQFLEKLARSGNRYRSFLYSFFGVTSPDATMQIPQYLNGKRIPVRIQQVVQTSSDVSDQPLGSTGAYSLTADDGYSFTTSFTEHGYLYTLACLRTSHTYAQGLHKQFTRRRMLDFYSPVFANIGEMPVKTSEIFCTGQKEIDNSIFGYQEAWAEYRYEPNTASGEFNPMHPNSLATWTYVDKYLNKPTLSADFIREPVENLDRTLIYGSETGFDQCFGEFYYDDVWTRVMPVNSIPGLYKF